MKDIFQEQEKVSTCISHFKSDKLYIKELMREAKQKKLLNKNISFSSLATDCVTEYLEGLLK